MPTVTANFADVIVLILFNYFLLFFWVTEVGSTHLPLHKHTFINNKLPSPSRSFTNTRKRHPSAKDSRVLTLSVYKFCSLVVSVISRVMKPTSSLTIPPNLQLSFSAHSHSHTPKQMSRPHFHTLSLTLTQPHSHEIISFFQPLFVLCSVLPLFVLCFGDTKTAFFITR